MNAQELAIHLAGLSPQPKSLNVDHETYANAVQAYITYWHDEDKEGTQTIELRTRNGHIVYKGVELILSNQS
jgi:hypothetical protein